MVNMWLFALLALFGISALVGGGILFMRDKPVSKIEDRLDLLTGAASSGSKMGALGEASILTQPLDTGPNFLERLMERFGKFGLMFEQADTTVKPATLLGIACAATLMGFFLAILLHIHYTLAPLVGLSVGSLPFGWLLLRRNRRMKAFGAQLPDALEMLARALRSGQSLVFGFNMVSSEMPQPIAKEFGRVFEEQNLGIPLEDSLRGMTERIPNLDLKFFVTALILQRQTGGDLAEILDKIGALIRDRFRIFGQIQALTGEGRLSGIVLLALPFVLFLAVYQLNPEYIMTLFTDPLGKKMLAAAVIMQILGALCIRKIINIKV
jgi:tight adherence protein B